MFTSTDKILIIQLATHLAICKMSGKISEKRTGIWEFCKMSENRTDFWEFSSLPPVPSQLREILNLEKLSKASSFLALHSKLSSELNFENVWIVENAPAGVGVVATRNSEKSARYSSCYVKWLQSWRLRISTLENVYPHGSYIQRVVVVEEILRN